MPKVPLSVQQRYQSIIREVVEDLSNDVTVLNPAARVNCPDCLYDSVTNKSSGIFDSSFVAPVTVFAGTSSERTISPTAFSRGRCPICFGEGQLEATSTTVIKALIDFFPDELRAENSGLHPESFGRDGRTYIILKAHSKYYETLLNAIAVLHEGIRWELVKSPVFTGVGIDSIVTCWLVQVATDGRITN